MVKKRKFGVAITIFGVTFDNITDFKNHIIDKIKEISNIPNIAKINKRPFKKYLSHVR
jgi:hypothetical protein